MFHQNAPRERFTDGALSTASGPKVIVMAYDRLDRDLGGAIDAIERQDIFRAHELLIHAQDLVHELLCMLDLDAWEHAATLADVYRFVGDLLVQANVRKDLQPALHARRLLAELGDGFRQAAAQLAPARVRTEIVDADAHRHVSVRA